MTRSAALSALVAERDQVRAGSHDLQQRWLLEHGWLHAGEGRRLPPAERAVVARYVDALRAAKDAAHEAVLAADAAVAVQERLDMPLRAFALTDRGTAPPPVPTRRQLAARERQARLSRRFAR